MTKHFSQIDRELREGLLNRTLVEEDIEKAADLARYTNRGEHRALYAQVKNAVQTQSEKPKMYTFDEVVEEVDKALKELNQTN